MAKPRIKAKVKVKLFPAQTMKAFQEASLKPMLRAGAIVEGRAKKSMTKGGRSIGPRGGRVQEPSAPGTPPHVQIGNLRGSITHAPTRRGTVIVGPGARVADYAAVHEFGGRLHPRRPFMRPALAKSKPDIVRAMKDIKAGKTSTGRRLNGKGKGPKGRGPGGKGKRR